MAERLFDSICCRISVRERRAEWKAAFTLVGPPLAPVGRNGVRLGQIRAGRARFAPIWLRINPFQGRFLAGMAHLRQG